MFKIITLFLFSLLIFFTFLNTPYLSKVLSFMLGMAIGWVLIKIGEILSPIIIELKNKTM